MEQKLQNFLDEVFAPYGDFPARNDVQQELLVNLQEKVNDLTAQGKGEDEAYKIAIESFGDVAEIMEELPHAKKQYETTATPTKSLFQTIKETVTGNVSRTASVELTDADLAGVDLRGSDFSMSALMNTVFDGSNLSGAIFKAAALNGSSFVSADMSSAVFTGSDLTNAKLDSADLTSTKFNASALKGVSLSGAKIVNTEFTKSDLSGLSFEGMTLSGVNFNNSALKNTSFKNAVFQDVSFHHTVVKHAVFDGATMDKVTYALLKSARAKLNDITIK